MPANQRPVSTRACWSRPYDSHVTTDTEDRGVAAEESAFTSRAAAGSPPRVVRVLGGAKQRRAAFEREHSLRDGTLNERDSAGLQDNRDSSA